MPVRARRRRNEKLGRQILNSLPRGHMHVAVFRPLKADGNPV